MVVDIVLVVIGLGLVVAGGLVRNRAFPGRRIAPHQNNAGGPVPQVLLGLGIALLAWGETQLQVRHWGGWAWLVLIPFVLAVWLPKVIHNRAVAAPDDPRRDTASL